MTSSSPSLAKRALLAVALMVGFYLLALGLVGLLIFIPYAEWTYGGRLHVQLGAGCVVLAGMILWLIVPRVDRFAAPGPRLEASRHPQLFAELSRIAQTVGQAMPAEVYLTAEANAWVSQRGGVMGLGSRRVMGLGLPLLQLLTVSQLRAVLAHEFGHYHGGDTKLGPWIYQTRYTIARTIRGVGERSWLQGIFVWYWNIFMQATRSISRQQEFTADKLAAQKVGSQPLVTALRSIHGADDAFAHFWRTEMAPALKAGFCPPVAAGFACFMQAAPITETLARNLEQEIEKSEANPYDTHPPLRDRIAAVQNFPPGREAVEDPPAISLLSGVLDLERQLLAKLVGEEHLRGLRRVSWAEVGTQMYQPLWVSLAREHARALAGLTPQSFPELAGELEGFGRRLAKANGGTLSVDEAIDFTAAVVGAALAVSLINQGWMVQAAPGDTISLRRGEEVLEPFDVLHRLAAGKLDPEVWRQRCQALGIAEINLGEVAGL